MLWANRATWQYLWMRCFSFGSLIFTNSKGEKKNQQIKINNSEVHDSDMTVFICFFSTTMRRKAERLWIERQLIDSFPLSVYLAVSLPFSSLFLLCSSAALSSASSSSSFSRSSISSSLSSSLCRVSASCRPCSSLASSSRRSRSRSALILWFRRRRITISTHAGVFIIMISSLA